MPNNRLLGLLVGRVAGKSAGVSGKGPGRLGLKIAAAGVVTLAAIAAVAARNRRSGR